VTLAKPLELVVTDVQMDPIGGPELAEVMVAQGLASRFLFVSGYGPAADYNEQFGPFLPKPFSPQRLVEAVAKTLG
jgi:FixJ family two-component response regulator